jgi:hypothetical protein
MSEFFDLNDAGLQRITGVIPDNQIVVVQIGINPGGIGPGGWERKSSDGLSEGVLMEFLVVQPEEYAKIKFLQTMTLRGTKPGHAEAGRITRDLVRALIEAAKGVQPNDVSEAAQAARKIAGWQDVDGLRVLARVGVEPPSNGYAAKNFVREIITRDREAWRKIEQVAKPAKSSSAAPSTPPTDSISRPDWAGWS